MYALDPNAPLGALYHRRVKQRSDLVVIISDYHNRRGTGKSTLSLQLAAAMDRTPEGLTIDKCSLSPKALAAAYTEQPNGSALVLDEAEAGLSKYRGGSNVNMAVRRLVSMGRVEEKYVILNLPASAELDRDLKALCDVWILVQIRGRALVHELRYNPYREKPFPKKVQVLEWSKLDNLQLADIYNQLTEQKRRHLRGSEGDGFVKQEELQKAVEAAEIEAEREERDRLIRRLHEMGHPQTEIAEATELSQARISQILKGAAV